LRQGAYVFVDIPLVNSFGRVLLLLTLAYLLIAGAVYVFQRALVFNPTHHDVDTSMEPWRVDGQQIGYVRAAESPTGVWLVLHGNGGQAAHRDYLLQHVADDVTVYVMEYPGYGQRPGLATAQTFNDAALAAYTSIRSRHGSIPVGVIGESIGSGPASLLAGEASAPAKIVLLVPFDQLHRVAGSRFPWLPVKWLMRDQWDNVAALETYPGPVEIYAARDDEVIPFKHAKALADALPRARLITMTGGHNSWQLEEQFMIARSPGLAADAN
jgi:pimeloyl-ACP methyl ester carboxylesterase